MKNTIIGYINKDIPLFKIPYIAKGRGNPDVDFIHIDLVKNIEDCGKNVRKVKITIEEST